MASSPYELIVKGESRTVQSKGEVTLPKEWRDKNGVEPKDDVVFLEDDDGTLKVIPPES